MKLLIATTNAGKLAELRAMLSDLPELEVLSLDDVPPVPPVEEDGDTFEHNARKKAVETARATGLPTLADDSGLEVDALDGAPGVYSARFAGIGASDADNNQKLLTELAHTPDSERTARFRAVLALALWPESPRGAATREGTSGPGSDVSAETLDLELHLVAGVVEGTILRAPRGDAGFGYDPLFVPRGDTRSMAELPKVAKNTISHRARALQNLRALLEKKLSQRKA
ncbi:MAG: non-canonical purine NTP pyrophosphatase [Myxococcales bacterium]|nr:non-canonical purine NTP pyrophosphatase [Myxococcales bacterium]